MNWTKEKITNLTTDIGIVLVVVLLAYLITRIVRRIIRKKASKEGVDKTFYIFMSHFIVIIIYFVAFTFIIFLIPSLKGIAAPLYAGSGVIAIVIGFASQHAFANIVGGIFIAIFKPFRIGDRIKFLEKNFLGVVEDVTLRHTVIRQFDNRRIVVPNTVISKEIIVNENIVENKTAKFFEIGISYDSDVDRAIEIIREEAMMHPLIIDNRTEEEIEEGKEMVIVRVIGYGDSSVNLRGVAWTRSPVDAYKLGCDLNLTVKKQFDKEGIEIPFPHRTIVQKK